MWDVTLSSVSGDKHETPFRKPYQRRTGPGPDRVHVIDGFRSVGFGRSLLGRRRQHQGHLDHHQHPVGLRELPELSASLDHVLRRPSYSGAAAGGSPSTKNNSHFSFCGASTMAHSLWCRNAAGSVSSQRITVRAFCCHRPRGGLKRPLPLFIIKRETGRRN